MVSIIITIIILITYVWVLKSSCVVRVATPGCSGEPYIVYVFPCASIMCYMYIYIYVYIYIHTYIHAYIHT